MNNSPVYHSLMSNFLLIKVLDLLESILENCFGSVLLSVDLLPWKTWLSTYWVSDLLKFISEVRSKRLFFWNDFFLSVIFPLVWSSWIYFFRYSYSYNKISLIKMCLPDTSIAFYSFVILIPNFLSSETTTSQLWILIEEICKSFKL
jgi:hypothetical protein